MAHQNVFNGQTVSSEIIADDDSMYIYHGGSASSTTITSGGKMVIMSGGHADDATIERGGEITILSGASVTNLIAESGVKLGMIVVSDTYIQGTYDGNAFEMNNGYISGYTVDSDDVMYVSSGGTAADTEVSDRAFLHILGNGVGDGVKVNNGGWVNVYSGADVGNIDMDGGRLLISSGARYFGTLATSNGATVSVAQGGIIEFDIADKSAGNAYLFNDLSAIKGSPTYTVSISLDQTSGVYNLAQGAENFTGTISISNEIWRCGSISVNGSLSYSGKTYHLTNVGENLQLEIKDIPGYIPSIYIYSSRVQVVTGNVIHDIVLSSGIYDTMVVSSGGIAVNTEVYSGGKIEISSGGIHTGELQIAEGGNVIVNQGGIVDFNIRTATDDYIISDLSKIGGTPTYTVTVSDIQEEGSYKLAQGASDFAGSITVGNGTYTYGTIGAGENRLILADRYFELVNSNGNLVFKVINEDIMPPEAPVVASSNESITKDPVFISATFSSDSVKKQYSRDGKKWVNYTDPIEFRFNGVIYFRGIDEAGNISDVVKYTVTNIDNFSLALAVNVSTKELTTEDVVLTAVSNVQSGTIEYSVDNGVTWIAGKVLTVSINGTYLFKVTDSTGEIIKSVDISNIDKANPETPIVSADKTAYTNTDVIVSAVFCEDAYIKQYSFDNKVWYDYTDGVVMENNGTVYFRAIDKIGNMSEVASYRVVNIDKVAPKMEISGNPTEWTNEDVVLTAAFSDGIIEYSLDGQIWKHGNKITVPENGTYYFRVTDHVGNVNQQEIVVDKIDKVAPVIEISGNPAEWTNEDITLTAAVPNEPEKYTIQYYDGEKWNDGDEFTVSRNGTYQFKVIDIAGNVTVQDVVVDKIDKVAPTLEITGNATEWTNQDVVLTAVVGENVGIQSIEYFDGAAWVAAENNKLTVSANGTYKFKVTDLAGNVTEESVEVTLIDKEKPTLEITGNVDGWTNQDVVLTAVYNDNVNPENCVVEYSLDGTNWVVGDTFTATENGTYKFKVTDLAGNVTEESVEVTLIDKEKPTLEITGNVDGWTNQDVVLTAEFNDDISGQNCVVECYDGNSWVTGAQFYATKNGTYKFRVTDHVGNVTEKEITVSNIDKDLPVIKVTRSETEWTKNDVTLTASVPNEQEYTIQYFDGKEWHEGAEFTVSQNGTYQFKVIDGAGNVSTELVSVENIDKVDPSLEITGNVTEWTNQDVVLTAVFDDNVNPEDCIVEYSLDDGETWSQGTTFNAESNGTYFFKVTDHVGNETVKSVVVDKIDKDVPDFEISGNATVWTNENVALSFKADEEYCTVEYFDGENWIALENNSFIANKNGDYTFRVVDKAGNISEEKTVIVDKIDKVAPDFEILADVEAEYTQGPVEFTLNITDNAVTEGFTIQWQLDGDDDWQTLDGNVLFATESGNYKFKVTDPAGNSTVKNAPVEIDKVAPEFRIEGNVDVWTNQDVVLNIDVTNEKKYTVQFWNGNEWIDVIDNKFTAVENGDYTFQVIDAAGNISEEKTVTVDKIDKVAPEFEIIPSVDGEWATEAVEFRINVTNEADSCTIEWKCNDGDWQSLDGNRLDAIADGTYKFRVTDSAGNSTVKTASVQIDREKPTLVVIGYDGKWTKDDIILNFPVEKNDFIEYKKGENGEWIVLEDKTLIVSENDIYSFRAKDLAGNISDEVVYDINTIDKVPPTLEITGNVTEWTNQDVVLTAVYSDNVEIRSIEYFDGVKWAEGTTFTATRNGLYKFRVTDHVGNVTTKEVLVDKIDKITPQTPGMMPIEGPYLNNDPIRVTQEYVQLKEQSKDMFQYSTDGENWHTCEFYDIRHNGTFYFRSTDEAGNISDEVMITINNVDHVADMSDAEYIFVNSKYTKAKTDGKQQNGIDLEWRENAFTNLRDAAKELNGERIILLDSKNSISSTDLQGTVVSSVVVLPVISWKNNNYSYKASVSAKGTLEIKNNFSNASFENFANVDIMNCIIEKVSAGKLSNSQSIKISVKNYIETQTVTETTTHAATGKISVRNAGSEIGSIMNYATVNISERANVGLIKNTAGSYTETKTTVDGELTVHTYTIKVAPDGKVTLSDNASVGSIVGYKTVSLTNSEVTGAVIFGDKDDANGAAYTSTLNKDGVLTTTYTRNGSITAVCSTVGDVKGYTTIKFTDSISGDIYQTAVAKNVDGKETVKLAGAVTLVDSEVGDIKNYASATFSDAAAEDIVNVQKITISKGFNFIGSYVGTAGNDTLTVNKNAVLTLGETDFGAGKNKLVNNGTLILSEAMDISGLPISGKGEIAADCTVWNELENTDGVLNLGATSAGFRTTAYEAADDTAQKAVKWDYEQDYIGWLSGNSDCIDLVDFIAIKTGASRESLQISGFSAGDALTINNVEYIADENGIFNIRLAANTEYTLELGVKEDDASVGYILTVL